MKFKTGLMVLAVTSLVAFNTFAIDVHVKIAQLQAQVSQLNKNLNAMSPDQIVQSSKVARSIALNQRFDNGTRIDANLTYSGFIGLLAKKKWSADYARIGYKALKENFDIDDRSELAALVFAKTIIEMRKQDWMKRQFIVNSLGIDFDRELDFARDHLSSFPKNAEARGLIKTIASVRAGN